MSRRTWALVIALISGGVLLQIPAHSGMVMPGLDDDGHLEVDTPVAQGTTRVDLEVTGMT